MRCTLHWLLLVLATAPVAGSCSESEARNASPTGPQSRVAEEPSGEPRAYPRATWRLANPDTLDDVVLWVSHILIRHADSDSGIPFVLIARTSAAPARSRTRAEALAVAQSLADRAGKGENFEKLAREYSEDVMTRDQGGVLGGTRAGTFIQDPNVLDALAAMKPGELSRPVETRFGFHVLKRHPVPEEQNFGLQRVLVRYAGPAPDTSAQLTEKPLPDRARALAIAADIASDLRRSKRKLEEVAASIQAVHPFATVEDLGPWSNRELGPYARERHMVSKLAAGEISEPIDSPDGVEILERTQAPERVEYVIETIKLRHSAELADQHVQSSASVARLADRIRQALTEDPSRFSDFQLEHCCADYIERLVVGRSPPELVDHVAKLQVGEISPRPLRDKDWFVLVRRVDPDKAPNRTLFELPQPEGPDIVAIARTVHGPAVQVAIRTIGAKAESVLSLAGGARERYRAIHETLEKAFGGESSQKDRVENVSAAITELEHLLSKEQFKKYQHVAGQVATRFLMDTK